MRRTLTWKSKPRVERDAVSTRRDETVSATSTTGERNHWVWFAAQCAQVIGVVVAIVGYFMTVVPVLQKERLEEQAAALENEIETAEESLAKTILERDKASVQAARLSDKIGDLDTEIESLSLRERAAAERTSAAELAARLAKTSAADAESYASTAKAQLSAYLMQTLSGATPQTLNPRKVFSKLMSPDPFVFESVSIATDLEAAHLDPFELATIGASNAKRWAEESPEDISKPVLAELAKKLEQGLAAHKSLLACPSVDFKAWEDRFQSARLELGVLISGCTEKYWRRVASSESCPARLCSLRHCLYKLSLISGRL